MTVDNAAFAALYKEHFDLVWRTVRGMGIPSGWVEDLVQEVFMAARRRWGTFDRSRSERGWLFGIARNEVLQFRRSAARYSHRSRRLEPPSSVPQPDEILEQQQAAARVEAFLDQLEEPVRLSFLLSELECMPGREVAQILGIPLQTHYSRVRAARSRLATYASQLEGSVRRNGTRG